MMIYFIVVIYFMCGVGVALALDDNTVERWRAIVWFLSTIAFWPMIFMFTITMAAKLLRNVRGDFYARTKRQTIMSRPDMSAGCEIRSMSH